MVYKESFKTNLHGSWKPAPGCSCRCGTFIALMMQKNCIDYSLT